MLERLAREQADTIADIPEPAENPVLVGHEAVARRLADAYRQGRLPHGLLFSGPQGIGKATFAFRLAAYLLANPDAATAPQDIAAVDPASSLFRQIAQGSHAAVLHLTRPQADRGKGHKSAITVDEVRRIARFLSMKTHDGGWRVIIVDPADDMNVAAANALLKNLEEPPSRTLFILISHSRGSLLPTIRSRCQIVAFDPLSDSQVAEAIVAIGAELPADPGTRAELLRRAGGSVREALSLTRLGGLEIGQAVDAVLDAARFDVTAAYRIGDAVSGREAEAAFDIFAAYVERRMADEARRLALDNSLATSDGMARLWAETVEATTATQTYNLDKRQYAVHTLRQLHEALRRR
jgi:DNA polymerase-3 subunit delta'